MDKFVFMKGIILAGGAGTRLNPITIAISKHLLPIYDKPMIYYPLSTLMLAGIRQILIITTPIDNARYKDLLKDGQQWGIEINYSIQEKPNGIAEALIIAEKFLNKEPCCLILGDNLFHGAGLTGLLQKSAKLESGAIIFAYWVADPQRYGVIKFDENQQPIDIIEKPENPPSNYVVPGIYFYDYTASAKAKQLTPSKRGELEITDLNRLYLHEKMLKVVKLPRGIAWLDTGTPQSLIEASMYIHTVEQRQGLKVGCPEEVAYRMGYINKDQLQKLIKTSNLNKDYVNYLEKLITMG